MNADLVKCSNCYTDGMKIPVGNEICPICGALGTLMFMDDNNPETECSEEEILYTHSHNYEPTDTEGYCCECQECGHYSSAWYGIKYGEKLLNKEELLDYSINNSARKKTIDEVVIGRDDFNLNFYRVYKDEVGPIYAEICSKYVIENLEKLYGKNSIESYETVTLHNGLAAVKAIIPNHPVGYAIVYKDDCNQDAITVMKNVFEKMNILSV